MHGVIRWVDDATMQEDMAADPDNIPACTQVAGAAKNFERIADYATNIAEDVCYMVSGKIVRHTDELS